MQSNIFHKTVLAAFLLGSPVLLSAQEAAAENNSYFSNALFNTLLIVIILLAILVVALGGVLKNIAGSSIVENRFKKAAEKVTPKSGAALVALFILSSTVMSAQTASAKNDGLIGGLEQSVFYVMVIVIALELLVSGFLMYFIRDLITEKSPATKKAAVKIAKERSILDKLNKTVEIEQEETIMLDHSYDGIRELDNDLPPWWKYGFYLTILISVVYLINYHITKTGPLQAEEYTLSVKKAEAEIAEFMKNSAANVDETTVTLLTEASDLNIGKDLYIANCAACHGRAGEGTVGPNLTDDYWLHAGGVKDIFKTIKYGWPDKGMKAWKEDFSPMQIAQITSYIKSLRGTNPANAKEKQGDLFTEEATPASDSTRVAPADTLKTVAEISH